MTQIRHEEIGNYGIKSKHERMDNGELRFRLTADDGSGYIRTVAGRNGSWQNSHFHERIRETYVVQRGWMAIAELRNGKLLIRIFEAGEVVTIMTNIVHNVYLPEGAVTHTVKHGNTRDIDWNPNEEFDRQTKPLSEKEILETARTNMRD